MDKDTKRKRSSIKYRQPVQPQPIAKSVGYQWFRLGFGFASAAIISFVLWFTNVLSIPFAIAGGFLVGIFLTWFIFDIIRKDSGISVAKQGLGAIGYFLAVIALIVFYATRPIVYMMSGFDSKQIQGMIPTAQLRNRLAVGKAKKDKIAIFLVILVLVLNQMFGGIQLSLWPLLEILFEVSIVAIFAEMAIPTKGG